MNSKELLREQIANKAVVHGKVILSSGKEADYYVDLRRVTLDHVAAPLVGEVMLELTKDLEFDAVGGLTLGADPVATAMMHVAASKGRALDSFVVRKAEKAHGLQRRIEGAARARGPQRGHPDRDRQGVQQPGPDGRGGGRVQGLRRAGPLRRLGRPGGA